MTNKIICISRQCGSGGRTIGEAVAKELGIKCYHAEIIEKIAEETGYKEEFVRKKGENAMYKNRFMNSMNLTSIYNASLPEEIVWETQVNVIQNIAKEGPCVIVGRCADYILSEYPNQLSVYIHAPAKDRMNRIVKKYGMAKDNPMKYVTSKDKRRTMFYEYYTDRTFGDADNYDLCLDSSSLGFDACIDIILNCAK